MVVSNRLDVYLIYARIDRNNKRKTDKYHEFIISPNNYSNFF